MFSHRTLKLLFFLFLATSIYSSKNDEPFIDTLKPQQKKTFEQGYPLEDQQFKEGYNAPTRIDIKNGTDFFITGSFLFWKPEQRGLSLASYTTLQPAEELTLLQAHFKYEPGFKIALGTHVNNDNWSLLAEYTSLNGESKTAYNNLPDNIFEIDLYWNGNALIPRKAISSWHIRTHILDGVIERSYYIGKKLTCNLYGGLRFYSINQKYNVYYASITHMVSVYTKSASLAIGPRAGILANWFLQDHYRFIGKAATCLSYQHFKVSSKNYYDTTLEYSYENKENQITPNFEGAIGFGWDSYFLENKWHIDFSILYEFLYFWNQNSMQKIIQLPLIQEDAPSINLPTLGNLSFQGLTISLILDF